VQVAPSNDAPMCFTQISNPTVKPRPSKGRLEFGQPLPAGEYGPDAAEDRALVFELTERVRDEIQRMVYENLLKRGRAFI